ncbi:MAG: PAS domain-containing protein [Kiritimatiellae bacterium]|nr:PAS domain-containing protein [Kiritimatiellia bacterium]
MATTNPTMKDHRSLFRQLLAGMYDAVLITDPSGHLLNLNSRAREYFRYGADDILDSPVSRFIPGVTPAIVQRIRNGLDQARHMMLDVNCLRKDGTVFPAEVTVSLVDLANIGDLVFTVRSTERRRRQLDAFRTKENVCSIAQSALFACAPDGRFRWANSACLDMFGYGSEDDLLKLSFTDLMPDEPLPELFAHALDGERSATRVTAEEGDAGAKKDIEIQLAPDLHGKKIVGVVGSIIRA